MFSAYGRYAATNGFKVELLDTSDGHIIAKVVGVGAFKAFQHETGQHCCQRVPRTENKGRRQTSVVSVAVLPIREEVWEPLPDDEIEIIAQRGTQKAGGQKANKTSSAIRATHVPTSLMVFIQNERSQHQNKLEAIKILTARVNDLRQAQADKEYGEFRKNKLGDGGRGRKIRTYNFIDTRVTDHQLERKTRDIDGVMKGDFGFVYSV